MLDMLVILCLPYKTLYLAHVTNLIFGFSSQQDEELYQLFCSIKQLESSVEAVRVVRDRHTSLGKGIAYVLFKTRVCLVLCLYLYNIYQCTICLRNNKLLLIDVIVYSGMWRTF